jgi:phosphatidylserine decarboxylase
VIWFFRNPARVIPEQPNAVVSPADGTVIGIEEVEEGRFVKERMKKVSIFMSVFNVHINRIPYSGMVREVSYNPGKFLVASVDKASLLNEQNAVVIETAQGKKILFVQIAGLVARRIVCYLAKGEAVTRGERFGLIRFGSRVDIYLPANSTLAVSLKQKVTGGETIIGHL